MGRLSRAASLIDGFNGMYDTIGRVQLDRALSQAANAQPVVDQGYTPDQAQQLDAAAKSGQYDVTFDDQAGAYKVAAKSDPAAVGTIAPQQRTTFQGKTVAGTMDDAAVSKARQLAMASVYERAGQIDSANKIRNNLQAQEDADFNRSRVKLKASREDKQYADDEAYKTDIADITSSSIFGQKQKSYAEEMSKYADALKAHSEAVAAGKPSTPPAKPAMPSMTPGERLLDATNALAVMAKHGRATPDMQDKLAGQMQALGDEGYLTFLRMAGAGATREQLAAAYNASGKGRIDPAAITNIQKIKRSDGVESSVITIKLPDGSTETVDTFSELSRLGKAAEAIDAAKRALELRKQDRIEQNDAANLDLRKREVAVHEGDAARRLAEFDSNEPVRDAQAAVAALRIELAQTEDPERQKVIEGKIRALSTGARAGATSVSTAHMNDAKAIVEVSGGTVDMETALANVIQRPQAAYEKYLDSAMKSGIPSEAPKVARKLMADDGWTPAGNGLWRRSKAASGATGSPGAIKPYTDADVEATAKKYGVSVDEVRRRLNEKKPAAAAPASAPASQANPRISSGTVQVVPAAPIGPLRNERDMRKAAAPTPAEAARAAAYESGPLNTRELELAVANERDPRKRALLIEEARKQQLAALAALGG